MAIDDDLNYLEQQAALNDQVQQCTMHMALFAKLHWEAFVALKAAGFTEFQALEIVCTKGWNLAE